MSNPTPPRKKSDSIMHRDIKDLEILRSLKRLAATRVTEWELKDIPNLRVTDWELKDLPNLRVSEWELSDIANYRVTEWELKDLLGRRERRERGGELSPAAMEKLSDGLIRFIRFVSKNLIDDADLAVITTTRAAPGALSIKLVLTRRDAAAIIGHGGHTASAIRNIVKHIARQQRAQVNLRILSHEENALEMDETQ